MPRYSGSPTIKDFPTDPVEIECKKCGRHGRYPKATLIEKYGSDIVLPDLLGPIAGDCELRGGLGNRGCGAIYPALTQHLDRKSGVRPTLRMANPPPHMSGTLSNHGLACSNSAARRSKVASSPRVAPKCTPTGRTSALQCSGTVIAGQPAAL